MPLPRRLSIHDARIAGLYDLEHTIGKGHFAVVKLARHVFTGEKVAVKVIDKTKLDKTSQAHMMQEVRCMKLVQHPNIVRLYEVIDTTTKLFLILELGDYDMYDYIMKNEHKGIKEADAQQYFSQIIKAIDYCHTLHVVHRDLKPENVVFFEKLGMVKLTDFGFSNLFEPGQQLSTSCGSLAYSAPEILLGDAYDAPAVDVWSLGVILYMLVCGRLPFQETNESETLTKILDCRFSIPEHVSQSCRQLIARMLVRDPAKRATLTEIVQSTWVTAGDLGHAETLPLIMKDQLPVSAHSTIVDQMVAGGIASEDQILNGIENDDYSYITATYYLLAERVLASYREEQALRLLASASKDGDDTVTPTEGESSGTTVTPGIRTRSRSNSWRGTSSRRACTILKEESEEELCSYLKSSSRQSSRNSSPSVSMFGTGGLHSSRDRISPQAISELLDFSRLSSNMRRAASPCDSRISSRSPSPPSSSGRTSPAITSSFLRLKTTNPSSSSGMRKLSSSPHLLGICEENEETIEPLRIPFHSTPRSISTISTHKGPHLNRGNRSASIGLGSVTFSLKPALTKEEAPTPTYSSVRVIRPRQAVVSPDMIRRYDQHPRLLSRNRRSTSCSSSETSDDDTNERKLSLIGSKYCKRNSDDKNNDDDGSKGGGGGGVGPRRSNSMKEQTILEEPANTHEKEQQRAAATSGTTARLGKNSFFLESPSPCSSIYSDSEGFCRQLSTPLQPIFEDIIVSQSGLFSKSQTAEEALFDWLEESKQCWEGNEDFEITEAFAERSKADKSHFYRLLRRSKSLESLKAVDPGHASTESPPTITVINDGSDLLETTSDSGCSSDDDRFPSRMIKEMSTRLFRPLGDCFISPSPLIIPSVVL